SFQEAPPDEYRDRNNALLTGCSIKMYAMRDTSQNPYNIAMAAVNLSDIQICSGNGAWGCEPDTADAWARVGPWWAIIDTVDWDRLIEARPWYAQDLVRGDGVYAAHYTQPDRVLVFLANRCEEPGEFEVAIARDRLPPRAGGWRAHYVFGREGDLGDVTERPFRIALPPLHAGPIGIELIPRDRPRG
ncbi:MAG: hypothetical protein JXP34_16950, partial [Planctomycetes bacterium]|nr:hypothetical protein [Planctomycetota bacterium]